MEFRIEITPSALEELKAIKRYYRHRLVEAIDTRLKHQPTNESKNRKQLIGVVPDFEHVPPIWELRVGDYRIFYDVDEIEEIVVVRAVRKKPSHMQTEDVL